MYVCVYIRAGREEGVYTGIYTERHIRLLHDMTSPPLLPPPPSSPSTMWPRQTRIQTDTETPTHMLIEEQSSKQCLSEGLLSFAGLSSTIVIHPFSTFFTISLDLVKSSSPAILLLLPVAPPPPPCSV